MQEVLALRILEIFQGWLQKREKDVLYFQVQEIVESVISPSILGPPYISDTVT